MFKIIPQLPPSINIAELKNYAASLHSTIFTSDSLLYHRIIKNISWAVVYLWFCECARNNQKGQAKFSPTELHHALPQLSTYQCYFFCHSMLYFGYFKRSEFNKWKTDFESRVNFVFPELIVAAEEKLKGIGVMEKSMTKQLKEELKTPLLEQAIPNA